MNYPDYYIRNEKLQYDGDAEKKELYYGSSQVTERESAFRRDYV